MTPEFHGGWIRRVSGGLRAAHTGDQSRKIEQFIGILDARADARPFLHF